jgi:hypothetical protein
MSVKASAVTAFLTLNISSDDFGLNTIFTTSSGDAESIRSKILAFCISAASALTLALLS